MAKAGYNRRVTFAGCGQDTSCGLGRIFVHDIVAFLSFKGYMSSAHPDVAESVWL